MDILARPILFICLACIYSVTPSLIHILPYSRKDVIGQAPLPFNLLLTWETLKERKIGEEPMAL